MTHKLGRRAVFDLGRALVRAGVAERSVDDSLLTRSLYSTDASLYQIPPTVIVSPQRTDDLLAVVQVAKELGLTVTARGAGTSISGNAVGPGIVIDFRKYMNRLIDFDPTAKSALVEPGIVLDDLSRQVGPKLRFGPDPSTHSRATIGGMIGNNACGSRALGYGRTSDNVERVELVTASGRRIEMGSCRDTGLVAPIGSHNADEARRLGRGLRHIADDFQNVIASEFARFRRQVSGYALESIAIDEANPQPQRLVVGSEGTLALVTLAHVKLLEVPSTTSLVVLSYPSLADAADEVPAILEYDPVAVEGIDGRIVSAALKAGSGDRLAPLPEGDAWLLVEVAGNVKREVLDRAGRLASDVRSLEAIVVDDITHSRAIWSIREDGAGLSGIAPSGMPAHSGWEDAAVPVEKLGSYIRDFESLMGDSGLTGMPYGHFGEGCLHVRLDFPFAQADGITIYGDFVREAARLVASFGGSLSGEHGDGRTRGSLLSLMYSREAVDAMRCVKQLFDPANVLNAGVLIDADPFDHNLRPAKVPSIKAADGFAFRHDNGDIGRAFSRCTGVGKCVASRIEAGEVMCPSYSIGHLEKDSTRGRARALQEMLSGNLEKGGWASSEVAEALDLCLSCKGCAADCPAGVDMAKYKSEFLHRRFRRRVRPRSHYLLGALPRWLGFYSRLPGRLRRLLLDRRLHALGRWVAGIDSGRQLPLPAATPFHRMDMGYGAEHAGYQRSMVLWIDSFTNHFRPEVAFAALRLLNRAGFNVEVVVDEGCCGLTWISTGQLRVARTRLRRLCGVLDRSGDGIAPIVCLEPSCLAAVRDDALDLVPRESATVAERVMSLSEFLTQVDWNPPSLKNVELTVKPHCHHHAVLGFDADLALLREAGADVNTIWGCCGLAGNWGMEVGHFDASVAIAEYMMLPTIRGSSENTTLLADGFSCKIQIEQLAGRPTYHIAEILDVGMGGPGVPQ